MFGVLGFKGKINLKTPERTFVIIDNFYKGKKYFGKLIAGKSDGNNIRLFLMKKKFSA